MTRTRGIALLLLLVLAAMASSVIWERLLREVPQPPFADADERFKYGSLGAESSAGIPYWIFIVLPRMFPEYLPGPGGYAALGLPWEQGHDLPVGFARKRVGFERVTNNCAVCHTTMLRTSSNENPRMQVAGPGSTTDVQGYFRFITAVAADPRFSADNLLAEVAQVTELDWIDKLIYRFGIIPILKQRLLERRDQFAWMEHAGQPAWGRGRDDSMNLIKYVVLELPEDGSFGPADTPSIWNLKKYREGTVLNWDGATWNARSVLIDSALGLGAKPGGKFVEYMDWLLDYLTNYPPPAYPFAIDQALAQQGRSLFQSHCSHCHDSERTGTRVPMSQVGTDPERLQTWNKEAAIAANQTVRDMGVERAGMVEETLEGYHIPFLDGLWLRAPYLHNGTVPSLSDLLEPPERRPHVFYKGYDVYDSVRVGFISNGAEASRVGTRIDVTERGNGNDGHLFGTELLDEEKGALLEYLKTL
jgi:mono/diheme cytochrome c family protein